MFATKCPSLVSIIIKQTIITNAPIITAIIIINVSCLEKENRQGSCQKNCKKLFKNGLMEKLFYSCSFLIFANVAVDFNKVLIM